MSLRAVDERERWVLPPRSVRGSEIGRTIDYSALHEYPMTSNYYPYPTSLSDAAWDRLQRFLPPRSPPGRLRRHSLRSVFTAHIYLLRTGCT